MSAEYKTIGSDCSQEALRNMEKIIMQTGVFSPVQLEIIDMMSFVKTQDSFLQLKQAISDFFVQKAQLEIDRLWETGDLNEEKVEGFRRLHERTPYI